ncbi:MAG TPA: M1 family aminopeptidase [Bryobacteraceae bacterium]|nr:M1 family aminopeptidase [Bryobacteraceae bacterium]
MHRDLRHSLRAPLTAAVASLFVFAGAGTFAAAQERRGPRIDVDAYAIDISISPDTQSLNARVTMRFVPVDDNVSNATFELNNALNVSRVVDAAGKQISSSRNTQDFTVRLNFDTPLPKGQPETLTFDYDGKLTGQEDSPVYGIKFAAIHPDFAYFMYPARWLPVSGYTTDRFAANMRVTVPQGYTVVAPGAGTQAAVGDKVAYQFQFDRASFPADFAVVKGAPQKVQEEGVTTSVYFRGPEANQARAYGEDTGKIMSYFTGMYGLPPYADLTLVETEEGAPNGYAAPGMVFLAPKGIGTAPNDKLLANQITRQWFEDLVSPSTRNHLWLSNGPATYAEALWTEHTAGKGALESRMRDTVIDALTVDNVPIIQSARLEDYSPEMWALTGSKGAAVLHMLRYVIGDDKFFAGIKAYTQQYAWKSASTEDFRKVMETASGQDLGYFFIQWIESSGAPEFKLDYTIYRTQKGFRVMGKISQDLDTFRMPVVLKIDTDGNPETKRVEVVGTSSEFSVDTFGKPKSVTIDPDNQVMRYGNDVRVAVAIRKGEEFMELSEFGEALQEYQKALTTNRTSSLAHYRIAEVFFLQNNYQSAANEFREALNGDLQPKWTEVWAHINLGKIFDITGQRERAVNEYNLAVRTKDNTQGAQAEAEKYLKQPYERQRREDQ